ncbi:hypothetical protein BLNAU_20695 [Blattamonas nauphoetae]|uniref:Uncharacterized protein n=1 Tax=Blattamonas nauphoetae TaxID=2049346 RepID=A0ABQ9WXZ6_9EUKA|nr:hypothetical protein BLNAU_20695 [Blattamonas nauphoetae]
MNPACVAFSTKIDALDKLHGPFLNFVPNSELSFEEISAVYCSLVVLVKGKHPFDNALQDRAAQFLKSIEPGFGDQDQATRLINRHLSSPIKIVGSDPTGITGIKSEACSSMTSFPLQLDRLLATVQPQTPPILGNATIISKLIEIIRDSLRLALPSFISKLAITTAIEKYNHREMIFQKVVLPSSPFIEIGPFHRPTLDFVLASPIVMAYSNCLSIVEDDHVLWVLFSNLDNSLTEWKKEGTEEVQSAKRNIQALFSEGFQDTLEQMEQLAKDGTFDTRIAVDCTSISRLLGSNVKRM